MKRRWGFGMRPACGNSIFVRWYNGLVCPSREGDMIDKQATDLSRFGNLIARCRREARRIIAGGGPNMRYRLGLVGERLIAAFDEIDACTTLEQRLTGC